MAENYNVGGAIALGTNLQPDTSQPLTRGTGQWLQAEMAQEARRQKQQQEERKRLEQISGSLVGQGSMFQDLDEGMRNLGEQSIYALYSAPSEFEKSKIKMQYQQGISQLRREEEQRKQVLSSMKGTVAQDVAPVVMAGGINTIIPFVQQNPDYADMFVVDTELGEYAVNAPKDINIENTMQAVITRNRNALPIEFEGSGWKQVYDNKVMNTASFKDEDLETISQGMAGDKIIRDNFYSKNRTSGYNLKPKFNAEFERLKNDENAVNAVGGNITALAALAKRNVTQQAIYEDLQKRNAFQIRSSKAKDMIVNFGAGDQKVERLINFEQTTGDDAIRKFADGFAVNTGYTTTVGGTFKSFFDLVQSDKVKITQLDLGTFAGFRRDAKDVTLETLDQDNPTQRFEGATVQQIFLYKKANGKQAAGVIVSSDTEDGKANTVIPLKDANLPTIASMMGVTEKELYDKIDEYAKNKGYSTEKLIKRGSGTIGSTVGKNPQRVNITPTGGGGTTTGKPKPY